MIPTFWYQTRIYLLPLLFFYYILLSPINAHADLMLNRMIIDYTPDQKSYQDIEVKNIGDEIKYVDVIIEEVINPGLENEESKVVDKTDMGLIVSPKKFILPAGSKKIVRFIAKNRNVKTDKIYRVQIKPVINGVTYNNDQSSEKAAAVKVIIAYAVLTIIRPLELNIKLDASRQNDHIIFTNNGNTNIKLFEGLQCENGFSEPKRIGCKKLSGTRLYPNTSSTIYLPYDKEVEFKYKIGNQIYSKIFN